LPKAVGFFVSIARFFTTPTCCGLQFFEQCLPKSCFCFIHPSTKGGAIMQLLTHIIFVLNLLKTLINHFT